MMEKIYLQDWLYNAGVVGFLKINRDLWEISPDGIKSKDENLLKIGENYIEIDRKIFEGFGKKFFDYAFNQYGRYERTLNTLNELKETTDQTNIKDNFDKLKNILEKYKKLKELYGDLPKEAGKNIDTFKVVVNQLIDTLEQNRDIFWENDAKIYLGKFYGQKSFLQKSMTKDLFKRFYEDFEESLLNNLNGKDKKYRCVVCERQAKKETFFDTGLSPFYGLNKDAKNFVYNFKSNHPICEFCEIIYFSAFAGFTTLNKLGKETYVFVNIDSTVEELLKENLLLEKILNKENKDLNEFFTELLINAEHQRATYTLQNISLIELENLTSTMPKIHTINLSREKAELIKDLTRGSTEEDNLLKRLSKLYYKQNQNDARTSVVYEVLEMILENRLTFNYLYKLTKIYLDEKAESNVRPYHLQSLLLVIVKFLNKVGGVKMSIDDKELWNIYFKGKELAEAFKNQNAENKVPSIAYKLLNTLRVGDTNQFMNILIRTYMAVDMEIPSSFVKTLQDKNSFYSIGYSFLNGFLNKGEKNQEVG